MRVKPNALSLYKNELWCACEISQNLIMIDTHNNSITEAVPLPFELKKDSEEYVVMQAFESGVVVAENIMNSLFIYEKDRKKWNKIDFEKIGNGGQLFSCSYRFGDDIYLFPGSSDEIVVYNIASRSVAMKKKLLSWINEIINKELCVINPVCVLNNHEVVGTNSENNEIFIYNVLDDKAKTVRIGRDDAKYSSCASPKGKIILFDKNNCCLVLLDDNMNIYKEMKIPKGGYRLLKYSDEYVLVDSIYEDDIYIVDANLDSSIVQKKCNNVNIRRRNNLGRIVSGSGEVYYYNRVDNALYLIDVHGMVKNSSLPELGEDIARNILQRYGGTTIIERNDFTIENYTWLLSID